MEFHRGVSMKIKPERPDRHHRPTALSLRLWGEAEPRLPWVTRRGRAAAGGRGSAGRAAARTGVRGAVRSGVRSAVEGGRSRHGGGGVRGSGPSAGRRGPATNRIGKAPVIPARSAAASPSLQYH